MTTPIPVGDLEGSCGECDLCCVLASSSDSPCTRLFWLCQCPLGTKVMQFRTLVGGVFSAWADVAGWVEDGPGFWYPYFSGLARTTYQYRIKCTLPAGEVFFSNVVSTSLQHPDCYASETASGPAELLFCRFGWTRQEYDVNDVLQSTTTGETTLGCNETYIFLDNSPHNQIVMDWTTLADGSGYRIRAYRREVGTGTITFGNVWQSLRTGWTKRFKCFSAVHSLAPTSGVVVPISTRRTLPPPPPDVTAAAYTVLTITSAGLEV